MERVLVTGISGFVGQHCAAELLKEGYAVRGTIRGEHKKSAVNDAMKPYVKNEGQLDFSTVNLLEDEGWEQAMQGCEFVLHVASPFFIREPKDEAEYIKPAVEGTLRVLKAAQNAKVKKVVLTSSTVAMMGSLQEGTLNAESWTDPSDNQISIYMKSKALAEKAAWNFIETQTDDHKIDLVVINPGGVFGPTLTGDMSGQVMTMTEQMITGHFKMAFIPEIVMPFSDVRDVAKLHVLSLKSEQANGKRILSTFDEPYSFMDIAITLKENGYEKVSTKPAPNWMLKFMGLFDKEVKGMLPLIGRNLKADNSLAKEIFDWKPVDFKQSILDTAGSIK